MSLAEELPSHDLAVERASGAESYGTRLLGVVPAPTYSPRLVVLRPPLHGCDWRSIRALLENIEREDLFRRFLRPLDIQDDNTLRRLLDFHAPGAEIVLALECDATAIGMLHRIPVSPSEAEIALIVRSDRKRRGIGALLVNDAIAWARARGLRGLSALALRDNIAVLRLARRFGFVWYSGAGASVELALDLQQSWLTREDSAGE